MILCTTEAYCRGQAEKQWKIEGFPSPRSSLMQAKRGRVSVFLQAVE